MRPILTRFKDQEERVVTAAAIGEPSMSGTILTPLVDDFVTYKSGAKTRFGRIAEVLEDNLVVLTVIKRNRMATVTVHMRTIRCVYRSTDQNNCSNI